MMINMSPTRTKGFPDGSVVKTLTVNAGDARDMDSIPGQGRFPWNRKWKLTLVFLYAKSYGQRSLAGSPWGHKRIGHN